VDARAVNVDRRRRAAATVDAVVVAVAVVG
jgi:hypothetical protein